MRRLALAIHAISACESLFDRIKDLSNEEYNQLSIYARLGLPTNTGPCTLADMKTNFAALSLHWNCDQTEAINPNETSDASAESSQFNFNCPDLWEALFLAEKYEERISGFLYSPNGSNVWSESFVPLVTLEEAIVAVKTEIVPLHFVRIINILDHMASLPQSPYWLPHRKDSAKFHWKKLKEKTEFLSTRLEKSAEYLATLSPLDLLDEHLAFRQYCERQQHYGKPSDSLVHVEYKMDDIRETAQNLLDCLSPEDREVKAAVIKKALDQLERQDVFIQEEIRDLNEDQVSQLANVLRFTDAGILLPFAQYTSPRCLFTDRLRLLAKRHPRYSALQSLNTFAAGLTVLKSMLTKLQVKPLHQQALMQLRRNLHEKLV